MTSKVPSEYFSSVRDDESNRLRQPMVCYWLGTDPLDARLSPANIYAHWTFRPLLFKANGRACDDSEILQDMPHLPSLLYRDPERFANTLVNSISSKVFTL